MQRDWILFGISIFQIGGLGKDEEFKGSVQIPVKWSSFLRIDQNNSELFHFLSDFIHKNVRPAGKTVVATVDGHVLPFLDRNNEFLQPCKGRGKM